jgi:hypothetical protein
MHYAAGMSRMTKSEVYSWRVSPDLKMKLEAAARDEKLSVGALLERIAREWLREHRLNDEEEQRRLRERVMRTIGTASIGLGPYTNERVRQVVTENLERKRRASQPGAKRPAKGAA